MSYFDKLSDYLGIEKILSFVIELIEFYFKPFTFFRKFFSLTLKDKIIQTSFYAAMLLGFGYILIEDITIRELAKALLFEIAILFQACIILILSDFIIAKIRNSRRNTENIIFFVILAKLLLAPFQLVFFGLFVSFENYNFFFLANLVVLGLFIYIFYFSAMLFQEKVKFIVLNILINFILLNLVIFISSKLSIDKYSSFESPYYTDQILKERVEKGESISEYYNIPSHRVLYKFKDQQNISHFLFSTPFDSTASGSFEASEKYHAQIIKNISTLDTIINSLTFKRNKDYFQQTLTLFKSIDSLMNSNIVIYEKSDIEKITVYMENDSIESHKEILINTPTQIEQLDNKLIMSQIEIEQISYYATFPLFIMNYCFPILLLTENDKSSP